MKLILWQKRFYSPPTNWTGDKGQHGTVKFKAVLSENIFVKQGSLIFVVKVAMSLFESNYRLP